MLHKKKNKLTKNRSHWWEKDMQLIDDGNIFKRPTFLSRNFFLFCFRRFLDDRNVLPYNADVPVVRVKILCWYIKWANVDLSDPAESMDGQAETADI
jgi:hypothetical protein